MYKEYREMSRCDAVEALYQDMAARHRARFRSIHVSFNIDYLDDGDVNYISQILKVVEVAKGEDIRRPYIKQILQKNLKFPLPHRVSKAATKKIFTANRPSTFY